MNCTNYTEATALLTGRCKDSRKLANNTYLERRGDSLAVRLHDTDVVTYRPNEFELNSGGWRTVTTKARINEFSPINVWQKRCVWYFGRAWDKDFNGVTDSYFDGAIFSYSGDLLNPLKSKGNLLGEAILQKEVANYAKLCAEALPLDLPSGADCWYCHFRTEHETWGEAAKDKDHLLLHISKDEFYIVPSLVYRALELYGSKASFWGAFKSDKEPKGFMLEHAQRTVKSAVRKYLRRQLSLAGN